VIFYEMVTGRRPFGGDYAAALLYAIAHDEPAPLADTNPQAANLQPLTDRMLARERAARLRSMDAVREALAAVEAPPRRRRWPLIAASVAAVLVAVVLSVVLSRDEIVPPLRGPAVAVLSLDAPADDGYLVDFATGFSGEVIAELAQVADLRVIAQSSMRQLATDSLTPAEIADRLGVDSIVGGTVRRVGDNFRVSAELLDARDSRVLWAESFETDPSSVLILQASVARAVAATLKGGLDEREERALSTSAQIDPRAYRTYLKARALSEYWGDEEKWQRGIDLLRNTTNLEPEFAPAWAALAEIYHYWGWFDASPERNFKGMSKAAVDRALGLDPDLAWAHVIQAANLYLYDQDFAGAEAAFQRALELAPGDARVHNDYANSFLIMAGRCDEAVAHSRRAVALDPLSNTARREHPLALINCRRFEESLDYLDQVAALLPEKIHLWRFRMWNHGYLGHFDEAVAAAETLLALGDLPSTTAPVFWAAGRRDEAWEMCGERPDLDADDPQEPIAQCAVYLLMLEGEVDPVLDYLEGLIPDREPILMYQLIDPIYDPIREHPRFIALTEAMNMTEW
jgi:TolB-like protein/Flp pilus assembly protein TadD